MNTRNVNTNDIEKATKFTHKYIYTEENLRIKALKTERLTLVFRVSYLSLIYGLFQTSERVIHSQFGDFEYVLMCCCITIYMLVVHLILTI